MGQQDVLWAPCTEGDVCGSGAALAVLGVESVLGESLSASRAGGGMSVVAGGVHIWGSLWEHGWHRKSGWDRVLGQPRQVTTAGMHGPSGWPMFVRSVAPFCM